MTRITPLKILLISSLFILSCNKLENKKELLVASQKFDDLRKVDREFRIFADSTFEFTESVIQEDYEKKEKWNGKLALTKDTIKFSPFRLGYNRGETAVLKNGFVEFTDGEEPDRLKIEKTSVSTISNIDILKFKNIAVFTFYKNFHTFEYEKNLSNYDLNTDELKRINLILEKECKTNSKLKDYNSYLKQIVAVKNEKNDIIIKVHFFCENPHLKESFIYYETSMMDGGNCNVYLELNLKTGKFNFINIAGIA